MIPLQGSPYESMVKECREIAEKHGIELLANPSDAEGINQYFKSEDGVEFVFYYNGLSGIKTPLGMITPLGNRSSNTISEDETMKELIERFGLELISDRTQNYERWSVYKATKLSNPSDKPSGMWKCAACENVQNGSTLYRDPLSTGVRWTCSDLTCGGTCYSVENKISA